MTPAELRSLLINHLPSMPGIEAAVPWPGRPYGLAVTAAGAGTVYWTITGASNTAPSAEPGERLAEQPAPDLPGGKAATAEIEQALLTAAKAGDTEEHFVRAKRYSTEPTPPAVGYGVTIDAVDGWRLFLACIGTARRGEELHQQRYFHPDATV
ncbi:hypothetical protein HUT16_17685 [Kitasatospora sp. NA04385]|uniref:hypothetical protein n=1 Tax=Kitasatospora sp. NA04385 TaxID=2742135 RepID=UPI0015916CC5|nr:hypothetical protein [Kitasatospora sp. NA04385]QKW20656.1 hypothetical protein HUT16_17685 [Kitasatospora sp. NA04385]